MAQQIAQETLDPTPVRLRPHDDRWSGYFQQYRSLIAGALGDRAVLVEHIGSTAVPGLLGRACVDILLAVAEPDAEEDYRAEVEALGFILQQREPDRRIFASARRHAPGTPQCQARLFVCRSGGTWEFDQLLLTHYLGAHEERRQAYADLKRRLAKVHRDDPDGYARAKRYFLRETVRLAHRSFFAPDL
ncbi:GrpB family protein [Actinospica sp. MGRD01-02]|uniref:GrpB family protein n=1 Tax=Actinospica acidithermotolerans TaxID=2828514 RepID=A0A941ECW2_9ACTN|nr:GrpB family protein [Actinospica acidithermotolerans]MBR7828070.1 GrpB family protein [Actinospica acidithermotolerans]